MAPATSPRHFRTATRALRVETQLARLGDLCGLWAVGLFNAEGDPAPLFDGLRWLEVGPLAARDVRVRRAVDALPAGYWRA